MKIPRYVSITVSFAIVIAVLSLPFIFNTKKLSTAITIAPISFTHSLLIGRQEITVAFAMTPFEQQQGLSGTKNLSVDHGMLFIFEKPIIPSFWMKDMNYPLDIIWIDSNKKIIGVSENLDPKTYPQTFAPASNILYVLEVPAGFYRTNYLKMGDTISF
ncbi:MAG: DUF192 domain-containing protein [bacterium]